MNGISADSLIAIEWLLIGIALCLILARLNLRLFHLKAGFVVSDAFIAAAFASGIALNVVDIILYRRGVYEPHIDFKMSKWVATEEESIIVYRMLYFLYFPFYLQQYFNKGTLISLYYEVFGKGSQKIRIALACLVLYCAAGFITTMCLILFYCKWGCYWSYTETCPQRCWKVNDNLGWAFHFSSDIFIFILPLVCISKLNMTKAQKISASITFSIGLINILISLARWFVVQAVFTSVPALNTGEALAVADGHVGLIVSILPSLRPYLRIWQKKRDSRRGKKTAPTSENLSSDTKSSVSEVVSSTRGPSSRSEETDHV